MGDSGTAMAWAARIDSSVTACQSVVVAAVAHTEGGNGMRTYIVVPVLDQERDARALCALAARIALQLVFGCGDIVHQLAVREPAAGQGVHDGGALGVMLLNGLEDGQTGQGGRHSDSDGRWSGKTKALGKGSGRVPGKRAREEIARPHGNDGAQDQRIRLQMQGVGLRQLCGGAVQPASQCWGCGRAAGALSSH